MLPTPVLSVSGKGFARLRISAWHFSPAPPILYAVRAIVYHKSRVLSRVLRDFSGGKAPGTPGAEPARHLLSLPLWCSQGAEPQRHWLDLPIRHPAGACFVCRLLPLPLVCFSAPYPPAPLPRWGRGRFLVYFAGGFAPGTPALDRLRHLQSLPSGHPAQGACGCPQKRQEAAPYEQCRQPRRGGTGGEELRRLRWSSPPGQVEPVPRGFSSPSPRGHHRVRDSQRRPGRRGHPPSPL